MESVIDYHLSLKELTTDCNEETLEERLRDQLVIGLYNNAAQDELLTQKKCIKLALEIALSKECASRDASSLVSYMAHSADIDMHKCLMHRMKKCKYCGRNNQISRDCHFKEAVCNNCSKRRHIKPVCSFKPG